MLPDRYLRVDTINGAERRSGFAGRALITPKGELNAERANFARLMLGLAAYIPSDPPHTFESTGESAFVDTVAVDVTGPAFAARIVFDSSVAHSAATRLRQPARCRDRHVVRQPAGR